MRRRSRMHERDEAASPRSRPGSRQKPALLVAVAVLAVGACGGGAQGDEEAFCDGIRQNRDALESTTGAPLGPGAIGVLRDLAVEAPEEIRSDLEDIGDYSSAEDLERSLDDIRTFIQQECDVSLAIGADEGGPSASEGPSLDAVRVTWASRATTSSRAPASTVPTLRTSRPAAV